MMGYSKRGGVQTLGFTLIELLVVIAIIGVLSSVVLVSLDQARQKARVAKVRAELNQIQTAMIAYFNDHGQLPPSRDNCSACGTPCNSTWTVVTDVLVNGGYMSAAVEKDPWGNYLCYDNNYFLPLPGNCARSYIYSAGPDKTKGTADDIRINDIGPSCK